MPESAARAYSDERKSVALETAEFSMINYEKSIQLAKKLNLDANLAQGFASVMSKVAPGPLQKPLLSLGLGFGLNALQAVASTENLKRYIETDPKNSIRLLFPNLDFNYSYSSNNHLKNSFD